MKLVFRPLVTLSILFSIVFVINLPAHAEQQEQEQQEEKSYYLEQMKKLSQGKSKQPDQAVIPADEQQDLLADTDLEEVAKPEIDLSKIKDVKPKFEIQKPAPVKIKR